MHYICALKLSRFGLYLCGPPSQFTGAGEPNFDGLDANPYRNAKQRQEWEVKALLEKIQPELISLDPGELGQVDHATFQQRHKDRVQALVSVWEYYLLAHIILYFKIKKISTF